MTINHPHGFAHSLPAGFDGVFDWDFMIPAFAPTRIQPMDIDCIVERGGHFLVFETKQGEKAIPDGQRYTLERLVSTGLFTVIVLRAKTTAEIVGWEIWHGGKKEWRDGDASALVEAVRRWFQWASGL